MPDDEMIGLPEDDAPADGASNDPGAGTQADNAQPPAEIEGTLLDNDEQPATGDEADAGSDDTGDAGGDGSDGDGGQDAEEEVSQEEPADAGSVPPAGAEQPPARQETPELVADPGEFTPKDYSFDIEAADGTKFHVTSPEDIDKLPEDFAFKNPSELLKAQTKLSQMSSGLDAEKRDWEAQKASYDAQETQRQAVDTAVERTVNEMKYLETKGKLPALDPKAEELDWSTAEAQKDPAIKARWDLLEYRAKENVERAKLNLSPMSLLEAHMQMQADAETAAAAETRTKQAEQRKKKGAMVGGASSAPPTAIPDDMIVGEGGNISDLNPAY